MSRLARKPIPMAEGVAGTVTGPTFEVRGPSGTLSVVVHPDITVRVEGNLVSVGPRLGRAEARGVRAQCGTVWALIRNAVEGAQKGFQKRLELHGVGYRAELHGQTLRLALGFTHPVEVVAPSGITFVVEKNVITVQGAEKARVGEVAASIRRFRPPEPYKGKGIRYVGEVVRRKAGKVAGATSTGAG